MTRTFFCETADPDYAAIHDLVRSANEKAESLIRPGVRFCDLDKAARDVISEEDTANISRIVSDTPSACRPMKPATSARAIRLRFRRA